MGSIRSPASHGVASSPVCSSWVTRNSEPNSAAYISSAITFAATKARRRKNRIGSIGAGARSSHTTNDTDASAPNADRRQHVRSRPTFSARLDQPPHQPEQARAAQHDPGHVDPPVRTPALDQVPGREHDESHTERHVQPEDPRPARPDGHPAAQERARRGAEPPDPAPRAQHRTAPLRPCGRAQQRHGQRGEDRPARSLDDARRHQHRDRRGEGRRDPSPARRARSPR